MIDNDVRAILGDGQFFDLGDVRPNDLNELVRYVTDPLTGALPFASAIPDPPMAPVDLLPKFYELVPSPVPFTPVPEPALDCLGVAALLLMICARR